MRDVTVESPDFLTFDKVDPADPTSAALFAASYARLADRPGGCKLRMCIASPMSGGEARPAVILLSLPEDDGNAVAFTRRQAGAFRRVCASEPMADFFRDLVAALDHFLEVYDQEYPDGRRILQ